MFTLRLFAVEFYLMSLFVDI